MPAVSAALASPGTLWIAYPKGSSKTPDRPDPRPGWDARPGRRPDVADASSRSTRRWSAFSLRHYKPGEARQTFR